MRENQIGVSCIAHNFFGFDFYYIIKDIRLSVWETKDLNIGGNNPNKIYFANIGTQVKFVDTFKFYQKSLGHLSRTATEEEKKFN